jgi:release factor glutamine methyltransferase
MSVRMNTPTQYPPASIDAWTTRRLLAWLSDAFSKKNLDSPRLSAEILISHVLGCDRLKLYIEQDRPASNAERDRLRDLVARALKHEPLQYLVGQWPFFGLTMKVDRRALIPRPCTELIVERLIQHVRAADRDAPTFPTANAERTTDGPEPQAARSNRPVLGQGLLIADVCTGSGCIAVSLAKHLPGSQIVASDLSPEALELARENAGKHSVTDRISFMQGDLLVPLQSLGLGAFDAIVSNPPYIPDDEWDAVPANVKHFEPQLALRAGPDGLALVRPLIEQGPALLKPCGWLLIEIAASTADAALALARAQRSLRDATILKDHEGLPRVLEARRTLPITSPITSHPADWAKA